LGLTQTPEEVRREEERARRIAQRIVADVVGQTQTQPQAKSMTQPAAHSKGVAR
jgi:hypothetical protein